MTTNITEKQGATESIDESAKFRTDDKQDVNHKHVIATEPKIDSRKWELDWHIIGVKIVCFVFIVVAWFIVAAPYASLVRYFLSPEVSCK